MSRQSWKMSLLCCELAMVNCFSGSSCCIGCVVITLVVVTTVIVVVTTAATGIEVVERVLLSHFFSFKLHKKAQSKVRAVSGVWSRCAQRTRLANVAFHVNFYFYMGVVGLRAKKES